MKTEIINLISKTALTTKEVAEQLGVSIQKVTGQMAVLKKDPMFVFENGKMFYNVVVEAEPETKTKKSRRDDPNSKMNQARAVFVRMNKGEGVERKNILAALMGECGLTKNGAATYLQNLKREHGLIKTKG